MALARDIEAVRRLPQSQRTIILSVGIVLDRMRELPKEDRDDLYDLLECYRNAQSDEDVLAVDEAILEILAQEQLGTHQLDLAASDSSKKLQKWRDHVGARVRECREKENLTQEQLAEKSGLPQSHISRIEKARLSPSHTTLEKIAAALGIDVDKLDPSLWKED